jgi:hypothetical protein
MPLNLYNIINSLCKNGGPQGAAIQGAFCRRAADFADLRKKKKPAGRT